MIMSRRLGVYSGQAGDGRSFSQTMKSIGGGVPPSFRSMVAHWDR